jgi:hypothetical protein
MVPGLKHGFDRVECALEASALGLPPARELEPPPPMARALPPAVPALAGGPAVLAGAASLRPQAVAGANLALLAAGTAATIYLWFRVFGADAVLPFPFGSASPAFERTSVAAVVDLTPPPEARPLAESGVRGGGSQPALPVPAPVVAAAQGGGTLVSNKAPAKKHKQHARRNRGPVARPNAPTPPPAPPQEPTPTRSAPAPSFPVPSSPPPSRVPGPTIPGGGGGSNPEQPTLPGGGSRG